jgi:alkaline phosphatase D
MVDYSDINPFNVGNFVGVEFMTPAITSASLFESLSQGIGGTAGASTVGDGLAEAAVRIDNPHIGFFNSSRYGYSTVRFSRTECEWIAYAVDKSASDPSSAVRQPMARFRKTPSWPFLVEGSTKGL